MKESVKKNIRSTLFLLGFFLMPNILFLLPVIYTEVAEEEIYQSEFGSKFTAEEVSIFLKFAGKPGAKEQREVDSLIGEVQTKLHNKNQGKLINHQFDIDGVYIILSGKNADDMLESAREVLRFYKVLPGSFARKTYLDKEPLTEQL